VADQYLSFQSLIVFRSSGRGMESVYNLTGRNYMNIIALENTVIKKNFGKIPCNTKFFASKDIGCEAVSLHYFNFHFYCHEHLVGQVHYENC
jgi:hypothetical protein